jgi:uncharacterized cupin superfamily protein
MDDADVTFTTLSPGGGERFQSLRRELGIRSFGLNLMTLEPGQRGRVHAHERQEEVYVVLEGELTLVVEQGEHAVPQGGAARVGPRARRQLVNKGPQRLVMLALGGDGEHQGRDGTAWPSWEDEGAGRAPQEVPLPDDLPGSG